ncbi:MAG TPA: pyridoxal-phosphate dependent enzyme [Wenzhouxiangella sp.]|nr:pyridoxal-phosphate dependent enzyme [Wenzhouxiangella sp.]
MSIYANTLALIGNTPIVRVNNLDTGPCTLYLKLEDTNPGGSIKDRIALKMIEAAEKRGDLKPGSTIIEGTAGNTGLGLALVAARKGYRLILVLPDKMSREKVDHLKAMGAEVIITRSDVGKGHPEYYQDMAEKLAAETENSYFINQFGNHDNPKTHEEDTGPEILRQMDGNLDAVVVGAGSSGTVTGLSRYFAKAAPNLEMVLADPEGSILADYINRGRLRDDAGGWMVEGIGEDFLPVISDFSNVKKAYSISDRESFATARKLLEKETVFGGSSTGTLVAAALKYCREQTTPKNVLTLVPDTGNKYLSKLYNDIWMHEQGFLEREKRNNLLDLIARPASSGSVVTINAGEPLANAQGRMSLNGISQLPVMEDGKLAGLVTDADLLAAVAQNSGRFADPVSTIMRQNPASLQVDESIDRLMAQLESSAAVIMLDGEKFVGLITRIDVVNHLRKTSRNA